MYHRSMNRDYIYLDRFIWDIHKAEINQKKHHLSFELAARIFNDPCLYVEYDANHSDNEDRQIYIGMCADILTVLTVAATERGEYTRIISARKATKKEVRIYEENIRNI